MLFDSALVADLGARIRWLRQDAGLTLDSLAAQSGVSRAMLSKVERGEKNPSLAVVTRIARGLGIPLSSLLFTSPAAAVTETAKKSTGIAIVRRAARAAFKDPETGIEREVLSPQGCDDGVEIVLHRIPAGKCSGWLPPYGVPVSKYIIVQQGDLLVTIGAESYALCAGDTMRFDVEARYSFANAGDQECTYCLVVLRHR